MNYLDSNRLKQTSFIILILFLGILLFWESVSFLPGFLGAITLYILMRPLYLYFTYKKRWNKVLTVTLLLIASFIILLIPVGLAVNVLTSKMGYVVNHSSEWLQSSKEFLQQINYRYHINLLSDNSLEKIKDGIANFLPGFLGSTFITIANVALMYFILYFMLIKAVEMESFLYEYIPLKDTNVVRLGEEVKKMVFLNALGIPLIAVLQSSVALVGYLIFGAPNPIFWFVATCLLAMLPVIGAAGIYIPMGIYIIMQGNTWHGVGLILFGLLIVSSCDNVFRFIVNRRFGNVHELVTIFGVIVGLKLFGFIGLIFGPLLIALFLLLLRIYASEFWVKQRTSILPRRRK